MQAGQDRRQALIVVGQLAEASSQGKAAAIDAEANTSAETLDVAIQRAEALAIDVGSSIVDIDVWMQALTSAAPVRPPHVPLVQSALQSSGQRLLPPVA